MVRALASLSINGGIITNELGALFEVLSPTAINFGGGLPRFDNAGTFRKSLSPGTFTLASVVFTNYGTVDIQSGVLYADQGGYISSSNAIPQLRHRRPHSRHQLRGQLQVTGAITLNGTLSVTLTNYIPATNSSYTLITNAFGENGAFSHFIYPTNQISMVLRATCA